MPLLSDHGNRLKVIEYLYQVAIDPLCYEDLLEEWHKIIRHSFANGGALLEDEELAGHIERANEILGRLENISDEPLILPLAQAIELDPNPAILISAEGKIVASNRIASEQFEIAPGKSLQSLPGDGFTPSDKLPQLLDGLNSENQMANALVGLLEITGKSSNEPVLLALCKIKCNCDHKIAGMLTTLAPLWSEKISSALQLHYDLTPAEISVIQELISGRNVSQIAQIRGTSLHTVRAQIKSILLKTQMPSQVDLIRQIGFLQRFEKVPGDNISRQNRERASNNSVHDQRIDQHEMILPDGRKLCFTLTGPAGGRPVLFIHGLVDSPSVTREIKQQLYKRDIRLIAPSRAGFGNSDPGPSFKNAHQEFAADAAELLDHMGIDKITVLGHMAGALFGFTFAGQFKNRVNGVLSVAGAIPVVSKKQIFAMSRIYQLGCLNAMHAPALLPIFIKGAISLLRKGHEGVMLRAAFKDAPIDRVVAEKDEIRDLLYSKFHYLTGQGHQTFQSDALQISRDWTYLVDDVECPVKLIHGRHDQVNRIEWVREFVETIGNAQLIDSENSGQLIFYNEPILVLDQLEDLINQSEAIDTPTSSGMFKKIA